MNYRHVALLFIVSIAFAACGAKQTPDRDAQTPEADLVLDGESFETVRVERTFVPDDDATRTYDAVFARHRALYDGLRPLYATADA